MSTFRSRQQGEDLGTYLKAKQDYQVSQGGTSTINFGENSLLSNL